MTQQRVFFLVDETKTNSRKSIDQTFLFTKLSLKLILLCSFILLSLNAVMAKPVKTVSTLSNKQLVLDTPQDYHLTSETPLINARIDLRNEDAWVFFDNLRPSEVISQYATSLKINGAAIVNNDNALITFYKSSSLTPARINP